MFLTHRGCRPGWEEEVYHAGYIRGTSGGTFDHIRHGGVKFHEKWTLAYFWKKCGICQESPCEVSHQSDPQFVNYGLISGFCMLISHLQLKLISDCKNSKNLDPRGHKRYLWRYCWPYKAWWCQITQKLNFGPLFAEMLDGLPGVPLWSLTPVVH